jgi:AcrR family transcriptional regulator
MPMPPAEDGRVPMRSGRGGSPGPRGGGVYLSRVQQTRLLDAAAAIVAERGVGRVSACRVAEYAGMSSKTFYDLFADGEDCFLAVFDRAVEDLAAVVGPVWAGGGEWVARVRGSLTTTIPVSRSSRHPERS